MSAIDDIDQILQLESYSANYEAQIERNFVYIFDAWMYT